MQKRIFEAKISSLREIQSISSEHDYFNTEWFIDGMNDAYNNKDKETMLTILNNEKDDDFKRFAKFYRDGYDYVKSSVRGKKKTGIRLPALSAVPESVVDGLKRIQKNHNIKSLSEVRRAALSWYCQRIKAR